MMRLKFSPHPHLPRPQIPLPNDARLRGRRLPPKVQQALAQLNGCGLLTTTRWTMWTTCGHFILFPLFAARTYASNLKEERKLAHLIFKALLLSQYESNVQLSKTSWVEASNSILLYQTELLSKTVITVPNLKHGMQTLALVFTSEELYQTPWLQENGLTSWSSKTYWMPVNTSGRSAPTTQSYMELYSATIEPYPSTKSTYPIRETSPPPSLFTKEILEPSSPGQHSNGPTPIPWNKEIAALGLMDMSPTYTNPSSQMSTMEELCHTPL